MTRHQTRVRRATPADPMPGVGADERISVSENRNLPPELGTNAIAVTEWRNFMYSDCGGDVPTGSIGGLVSEDTRLLSTWRLLINGSTMLTLQSGVVEPYWAGFFLTNPELSGLRANTLAVRRLRLLGEGYGSGSRSSRSPRTPSRSNCGSPSASTSPTCSRSSRRSGNGPAASAARTTRAAPA
jgi:hypothetical protein